MKLGHQKLKQATDNDIKRTERSTNRELKRRHAEAAIALLDLNKQSRLSSETCEENDSELSGQGKINNLKASDYIYHTFAFP